MMRALIAVTAVTVMANALGVRLSDAGQDTTVKDGVYTTGQAGRGRERYESFFGACADQQRGASASPSW